MDKEGKRYLKDALRIKRPHERLNKAVARAVSKRKKDQDGYKLYIDIMNEVRKVAYRHRESEEEAARRLIGSS